MSNLDDFFNKRDKKKKTTKTKFPTLNTDEFAKQLEATTSANRGADDADYDFVEVERIGPVSSGSGPIITNERSGNENQDEEWKPFDSEDNKDYSGLRINTQNWKAEDEDSDDDGFNDENERKPACPWGGPSASNTTNAAADEEDSAFVNPPKPHILNDSTNQKAAATQVPHHDQQSAEQQSSTPSSDNKPQQPPTSESTSTASSQSAEAAAPKAYIPPGMRNKMESSTPASSFDNKPTPAAAAPAPSSSSSGSTAYLPPSMRNKPAGDQQYPSSGIPTTSVNYRRPPKSQPNINDLCDFPSLANEGLGASEKTVNGGATAEKFEQPKKSSRVDQKSDADRMINLENKFSTLSS